MKYNWSVLSTLFGTYNILRFRVFIINISLSWRIFKKKLFPLILIQFMNIKNAVLWYDLITLLIFYLQYVTYLLNNFKKIENFIFIHLRIVSSCMTETTTEGIWVDFIEPSFYLTSEIWFWTSLPCRPRSCYILSYIKSVWNKYIQIMVK